MKKLKLFEDNVAGNEPLVEVWAKSRDKSRGNDQWSEEQKIKDFPLNGEDIGTVFDGEISDYLIKYSADYLTSTNDEYGHFHSAEDDISKYLDGKWRIMPGTNCSFKLIKKNISSSSKPKEDLSNVIVKDVNGKEVNLPVGKIYRMKYDKINNTSLLKIWKLNNNFNDKYALYSGTLPSDQNDKVINGFGLEIKSLSVKFENGEYTKAMASQTKGHKDGNFGASLWGQKGLISNKYFNDIENAIKKCEEYVNGVKQEQESCIYEYSKYL